MTAAELQTYTSDNQSTDSTTIPQSNGVNQRYLSCESYHNNLNTTHTKIYRYNAFIDLVDYLQTTLLTNLPYINYPTNEILTMILSGTQLTQADDPIIDSQINLTIPCTKYLNSLLSIFDRKDQPLNSHCYNEIHNEELEGLYTKMKLMFQFLQPTVTRRGRKRKIMSNGSEPAHIIDTSIIDESDDDQLYNTNVDLRKDRIDSLFEVSTTSNKFTNSDTFFGIPYLANAEKNMWYYVIYPLKIASKLTDIERMDTYLCYKETWSRWRELLNILIRFMKLDLKRNFETTETLLVRNLLRITGCQTYDDATPFQLTDSLLTTKSYIFSDMNTNISKNSILPIDLALSNINDQLCSLGSSNLNEPKTMLDLDSIPLRHSLLELVWSYCRKLQVQSMIKLKFVDSIATTMNKLNNAELSTYYQFINNTESNVDSVLFPVSFEVMRLMFKAWTITSENFSTDITGYIHQLQKLNQFLRTIDEAKPVDVKTSKYNELFSNTKKFVILAKYQLLMIKQGVKFNDEEWKLLNSFIVTMEDGEFSLGHTINTCL